MTDLTAMDDEVRETGERPKVRLQPISFDQVRAQFVELKRVKKLLSSKYGSGYVRGTNRSYNVRPEPLKVYMSDVVKPDHAVVVNERFLETTSGIYVHPIDYYWAKYWDKPEVAHAMAQAWMSTRLERMTEEALERIDGMYRENDMPEEGLPELLLEFEVSIEDFLEALDEMARSFKEAGISYRDYQESR